MNRAAWKNLFYRMQTRFERGFGKPHLVSVDIGAPNARRHLHGALKINTPAKSGIES